MTANQMIPAVGQQALVRFEQIKVLCRVLDVKKVYGRLRFEVTPFSGCDSQWVEMDRIAFTADHPSDNFSGVTFVTDRRIV